MRQVFLELLRGGELYAMEVSTSGEELWCWWLANAPIVKEQRLPMKAYREYKGIK
jgi:hypothetical protein